MKVLVESDEFRLNSEKTMAEPPKREKIRPNLPCFVELGGATNRGFQLPGGFTAVTTNAGSARTALARYNQFYDGVKAILKEANGGDDYFLGESRSAFVRARSEDSHIVPRKHLTGKLQATTEKLNEIVASEADDPFPKRAEVLNLFDPDRRDARYKAISEIRWYAPTTVLAAKRAERYPKLKNPPLFPANHGL